MKKREIERLLICVVLVILFVNGCGEAVEREKAFVTEVIDGDTIKVSSHDGNFTVRLLNINTPEKNEKCYEEAKFKLSELIEDKEVFLEADVQKNDQYKRQLRYVFLNDGHVNLLLVKEGLATVYIIEPNTKYKSIFERTQEEAKQLGGCLWKKGSSSGCISVVEFNYNAEGDDCKNANDEYVVLKNSCGDIDMSGWTVKDEARHVYRFNFVFKKESQLTLYSGSGTDTQNELYWNSKRSCPAVWNNGGDTLFLRDAQENLVLEHGY